MPPEVNPSQQFQAPWKPALDFSSPPALNFQPDSATTLAASPNPGTAPAPNAGLDDETSAELGKLLDEQQARIKRKDRKNRFLGLAALIALSASGTGWVACNPDRIAALNQAIADVRSAGNFKASVAKYQAAFDTIAVHGDQIDAATKSLGVGTELKPGENAYMTQEMRTLTGNNSISIGERNEKLAIKSANGLTPASIRP